MNSNFPAAVISLVLATTAFSGVTPFAQPVSCPVGPSMITLDYERYLARVNWSSDSSTEWLGGPPIGNGRMATIFWSVKNEPSKLHFDVGRPDVFYSGGNARETGKGGYGDGRDSKSVVGQFSVDFGDPVFAKACRQSLDVWNGRETIAGEGVRMRACAAPAQDVIALEIEDLRENPRDITVEFTSPRPEKIVKNTYASTAVFSQNGGAILLSQTASDAGELPLPINRFHCAASCAAGVLGRNAQVEPASSPSVRRIRIPAGRGKFTLLVSTATGMEETASPDSVALAALGAAKVAGTDALFDATAKSQHAFWQRSFIHLPDSKDKPALKTADGVWAYYLYSLNTINRGAYPINNTGGGVFALGVNKHIGWCEWGSKYWFFDVSRQACVSVFEMANHPEIADPWLRLLDKGYERFHQDALQQWGCSGDAVEVPETFSFDGPEVLPPDIARDLADMYLNKVRSPELKAFAVKRSHWESRFSPFEDKSSVNGAWHSHTVYNTGEVAQWHWDRFLYTGDKEWLKNKGYRYIKGVVEFYRTHGNFKKEADGKYHLSNIGWAETVWGGMRDGVCDFATIRGVLPLAVKASEILNVDAELRPQWREMLENLAPYPTNKTPNAIGRLNNPEQGGETYAIGVGPVSQIYGNRENGSVHDPRLLQISIHDLVNLEAKETGAISNEVWTIAMNTMEKQPAANAVRSNGNVAFSRFFGEAARMGRADLVELCLSRNSYFKETGPYPRAWQPHGIVSEGISQALLQSLCASPGADPVIRVFPAWPASRDACFSLRAKGDFLVTSAMRGGQISFVEIQPARGGVCRLRNPWGKEQAIQVWRDGKKNELLTGSLLTLETKAGGDLVLTIQDTTLHKLKLNLP